MAISTEIIGKLGGAEVETSTTESYSGWRYSGHSLLVSLPIPAGQRTLVAVTGNINTRTIPPILNIGTDSVVIKESADNESFSHVAEVSGPVDVSLYAEGISYGEEFSWRDGIVYTVPLD